MKCLPTKNTAFTYVYPIKCIQWFETISLWSEGVIFNFIVITHVPIWKCTIFMVVMTEMFDCLVSVSVLRTKSSLTRVKLCFLLHVSDWLVKWKDLELIHFKLPAQSVLDHHPCRDYFIDKTNQWSKVALKICCKTCKMFSRGQTGWCMVQFKPSGLATA